MIYFVSLLIVAFRVPLSCAKLISFVVDLFLRERRWWVFYIVLDLITSATPRTQFSADVITNMASQNIPVRASRKQLKQSTLLFVLGSRPFIPFSASLRILGHWWRWCSRTSGFFLTLVI